MAFPTVRRASLLLCLLLACTQPLESSTSANSAGAGPRVGLSALADAGGDWNQSANDMKKARSHHTATLLLNGKVLITGGAEPTHEPTDVSSLKQTEIYDPATGESSTTSDLTPPRFGHTATLLRDGRVLVAGGFSGDQTLAEAKIYDPSCPTSPPQGASDSGGACATWTQIAQMNHARAAHTATLLRDGRVLMVGGVNLGLDAPAELYDPATGTWTDMKPSGRGADRSFHTATLLRDGRVLVLGGLKVIPFTGANELQIDGLDLLHGTKMFAEALDSAEVYDPEHDTWTPLRALISPRVAHSATLMPNGTVLVVGGWDKKSGWTDPIRVNMHDMTATGVTALASAELYDLSSGGNSTPTTMPPGGRAFHTATLLPDGRVLITGGNDGTNILDTTSVYDPNQSDPDSRWSSAAPLPETGRVLHTATLLPGGRVLVVGGYCVANSVQSNFLLYDPNSSTWSSVASMTEPRREFTATLLPNGKVLVVGGTGQPSDGGTPLGSAELYAISDGGSWSPTPTTSLHEARRGHTATLLPDGKVLVVGGLSKDGRPLNSAELYDPATSPPSWTSISSESADYRGFHTATLLPTGRVLAVGGRTLSSDGGLMTSEGSKEYDIATATWDATSEHQIKGRSQDHTATLLPDGRVLIAGGRYENVDPASSLYDPFTRSWSDTKNKPERRYSHTATLLLDGRVLVAGGYDSREKALKKSELYDPASKTWSPVPVMDEARAQHAAILLPTGQVLVTGGYGDGGAPLASCELYDPVTGKWSLAPPLHEARAEHALVALPDGNLLVLGGSGTSGVLSSAELYSVPGGTTAQRVLITHPKPIGDLPLDPFEPGVPLIVMGEHFQDGPEASSGASSSSAVNFPLVRLRSFETGQWLTPPGQSFTDTSATVPLPPRLPDGHYLLNVTTSGETSSTVILVRNLAAPDTFITSAPPSAGKVTEASFLFSSLAQDVQSYECSLDYPTFIPCSSPWSFGDLREGEHTFQVRARDTAGNQGPPDRRTWLVDTQPPGTVFIDTPLSETRDTSAVFRFGSPATDVASYECSLDDAAFTPCTSPVTLTHLRVAGHVFKVQSTDTVGNVTPKPARYSWTVMRGYYGVSCSVADGSLWQGAPWALVLLALRGRRRSH